MLVEINRQSCPLCITMLFISYFMLFHRDDEENHRKYHVPRRRRLGFPPITPNACVRDSVLQQIFDLLWSRIVACFSHPIKNKSLIKVKIE